MVGEKGLLYMGMGVSGGEEGARNGETSIFSTMSPQLQCLGPQCWHWGWSCPIPQPEMLPAWSTDL